MLRIFRDDKKGALGPLFCHFFLSFLIAAICAAAEFLTIQAMFYDFPGVEEYKKRTGIDLSVGGYVGRKGQGRKPIEGPAGRLGPGSAPDGKRLLPLGCPDARILLRH